jgi:hypothetical protein
MPFFGHRFLVHIDTSPYGIPPGQAHGIIKTMLNLVNWQIFLKVLPVAALFAIAKFTVHYCGWEPWTFSSLPGVLLSVTTFTIALVLSSTLADYRASEAMPLQITNALDTINDANQMLTLSHPHHAAQPLQQGLWAINTAVLTWLEADGKFDAIETALDQLNPLFAPIMPIDSGPLIVNRMQAEQARIRSIIWQMKINRDTDFVAAAYVLLWMFLSSSTIALLLINSENFSENLLISTFLIISFFYLLVLIRDLDNPFEYDGNSCVDVDLTVLHSCQNRLRSCLAINQLINRQHPDHQ